MLSWTGQCCSCHSDLNLNGLRTRLPATGREAHAQQKLASRRRARLDRRLSQAAHNNWHKGPSRRCCISCHATAIAEPSESGWHNDGWTTQYATSRHEYLRQWVKEISPDVVAQFMKDQPPQVTDAVQHLIFDQLGRLPPNCFYMRVSAKKHDLAELLKSCMHQGYAFRNAQFALEALDKMLEPGCAAFDSHQQQYSLPVITQCLDNLKVQDPSPSKLTQVSGEVSQWDPVKGEVKCDAAQYIRQLESQREILQNAVSTQLYVNAMGYKGNKLLTYLRTLPFDKQRTAWYLSDDIKDAMSDFIHICLDTDFIDDQMTEHNQMDYARLLMYSIVVGFLLRQEETMSRMF